jgi:hypothetical protein
LFISPGAAVPQRYYEIEVSPNGVVWDGMIENPHGDRRDMVQHTTWNCRGLRVCVERDDPIGRWTVTMAIPWVAIDPTGERPRHWRANLYRIERPRAGTPEFSGWSPTRCTPPDFHKPMFFGIWVLA